MQGSKISYRDLDKRCVAQETSYRDVAERSCVAISCSTLAKRPLTGTLCEDRVHRSHTGIHKDCAKRSCIDNLVQRFCMRPLTKTYHKDPDEGNLQRISCVGPSADILTQELIQRSCQGDLARELLQRSSQR